MTQAATATISVSQALAVRRYAKDFERSKREHHCRIGTMDELKAARAALIPQAPAEFSRCNRSIA